MLVKYALLLVLFFPVIGFPQSSIQNEDDLLAVLVALKPNDRLIAAALLEEHQNLVTNALWLRLVETAVASSDIGNLPKSLFILEVARNAAEQLNDRKLVASTIYRTGKLHSDKGNNTAAINAYLESKQIFETAGAKVETAYVLSEVSALYLFTADYEKAKEYAVQGLALANTVEGIGEPDARLVRRSKAAALSALGNLSKQEGAYDQAVDYLQQTLALFSQLDEASPSLKPEFARFGSLDEGNAIYKVEIAYALTDIGRIYRVKGDHLQALHYLNQALTLAKDQNMKFALAGALNSIGILYIEQGDYTKAADFLNHSLEASVRDNDPLGIARVPINLGVIQQRQGNYEAALKHFQTALTRAEAISATEIVIAAQQGLGAVYKELGDYPKALEWLERSLTLAQKIGDKPLAAELLWRKAELHYARGDFSRASVLADDAIGIATTLRLPVMTHLAFTTKGKASLSNNEPDRAVQALTQAINQIETMRNHVAGGDQERQLFFENKVVPYNLMVELLVRQNKVKDALLYAERAKGRVLFDILSGGRVDVAKFTTSDEREEEQRLNQIIVELNNQLRREQSKPAPDAALLGNIQTRLDTARVNYESFQNVLYAAHPELSLRRGQTPVITSAAISNFIKDKSTALLEYVVTKDKTYLFVLTRKEAGETDLRVYPINIKADGLEKKTSKFRRMMADRNPVFAVASSELYELLVKPAEQQLRGKLMLCIIPDGTLWDVPFQALQSEAERYLIEDHALYYAPSLSILNEMTKPSRLKTKRTESSLIAFGNPVVGGETVASLREVKRGESFEPLPEAEMEVTTLERLFGTGQSKVFVGVNANENRFKALAPSYSTIHLATHGVLDNHNPLYSYLLLSKANGVANDDGLLEAREIMSMNLNADLAVLSACETARGRIGAGEGVIGMSWAFFVAGVRTTIVSQWKVNSKSTSQLMVNFYKHLRAESTQDNGAKANALRAAALEMMKDERYRHPFYWAGFVMIGSNSK